MNTYLFYRRIRGPIFLLTFGVTALLSEMHVLRFWQSWPLYLIVAGVLRLAEGTVLAASAAPPLYPAQSFSGAAYQPTDSMAGAASNAEPAAVPGTGLATVAPAPIQSTGQSYRAGTEEES